MLWQKDLSIFFPKDIQKLHIPEYLFFPSDIPSLSCLDANAVTDTSES